jgi:hypothetical protein
MEFVHTTQSDASDELVIPDFLRKTTTPADVQPENSGAPGPVSAAGHAGPLSAEDK